MFAHARQTPGETAGFVTRWRIVHRHGSLAVSDSIVWVGAVAEHRGEAIAACEFMMDTLKTDAPFWKREEGVAGDKWVERGIDTRRRERWQEAPNEIL